MAKKPKSDLEEIAKTAGTAYAGTAYEETNATSSVSAFHTEVPAVPAEHKRALALLREVATMFSPENACIPARAGWPPEANDLITRVVDFSK